MLNFSNILSFSRALFVLAFLQDNPIIRLLAILLAMLSDFLDGYVARKHHTTSKLGAILDPIMDKFFVFFVGGVLYFEGWLAGWELLAVVSREISLCAFGVYLLIIKGWKGYECRPVWWGKVITVAQFLLLIGLTVHIVFPPYVYYSFVVMAAFAFIELLLRYRRKTVN